MREELSLFLLKLIDESYAIMHGKKREESLFIIAYTFFFLIKSNEEDLFFFFFETMKKIFETST